MKRCMGTVLMTFVALMSCPVSAQEYPSKSVRIIVSFAPGGPNDLAVRPVAQKLQEILGQPFSSSIIVQVQMASSGMVGGHVDSMFISAPGAIAQIRAGKVRPLAVASARRAASLPDVPTFAETGYAGVQVDTRYGIIAPAETPTPTINRLQTAIVRALGASDLRERYNALSLEPSGSTPQEFAAYLRNDIAKWRKVFAAAKLPPQ